MGGPPPLPNIPGLVPRGMRPMGLNMPSEQMLAFLVKAPADTVPPDSDEGLPVSLRPYAAGLRPTPRPAGVAWQEEVVYEKIGKTDAEIAQVARYYFGQARNYDDALSRQRVTPAVASCGEADKPLQDGDRSKLVLTLSATRSGRGCHPFCGCSRRSRIHWSRPISSEAAAGGDDRMATALARQATDYARWALFTANSGWQVLHDCLLDALTRKAGWVRWHWGAKRSVRTEVCEGLLLPQLQMLLAEPGIEASRIVRRPMTQGEQQALAKSPDGQMYLQQGAPARYWAATITRTASRSWRMIEAVSPECVWVVADANTVEGARAIFHVRDVSASDLIEMGCPRTRCWRTAT